MIIKVQKIIAKGYGNNRRVYLREVYFLLFIPVYVSYNIIKSGE